LLLLPLHLLSYLQEVGYQSLALVLISWHPWLAKRRSCLSQLPTLGISTLIVAPKHKNASALHNGACLPYKTQL
jgi:hypothetical protein